MKTYYYVQFNENSDKPFSVASVEAEDRQHAARLASMPSALYFTERQTTAEGWINDYNYRVKLAEHITLKSVAHGADDDADADA